MPGITIETKVRTLVSFYDVLNNGSPKTLVQAGRKAKHPSDAHRWIALLERWGLVERTLHRGRLAFRAQQKLPRAEVLRLIGRHATDPLPRGRHRSTRGSPKTLRTLTRQTESRAILTASRIATGDPNATSPLEGLFK